MHLKHWLLVDELPMTNCGALTAFCTREKGCASSKQATSRIKQHVWQAAQGQGRTRACQAGQRRTRASAETEARRTVRHHARCRDGLQPRRSSATFLLRIPKKALKEFQNLSEQRLNAFARFLDPDEPEEIVNESHLRKSRMLAVQDRPTSGKLPAVPAVRAPKKRRRMNTDTACAAC